MLKNVFVQRKAYKRGTNNKYRKLGSMQKIKLVACKITRHCPTFLNVIGCQMFKSKFTPNITSNIVYSFFGRIESIILRKDILVKLFV